MVQHSLPWDALHLLKASIFVPITSWQLHVAVKEGHLDIVKYLVDSGADINTQTDDDVSINQLLSLAGF
jgi:hypothetical protein